MFLTKFPTFPAFLGLKFSLTLARNELKGSHLFRKSKFKEIQGENLHNFKVLLMMYDYRKAAFTFEVSFSTPTYDARWMRFSFTHSLMNIVRSIDLHNSLETS